MVIDSSGGYMFNYVQSLLLGCGYGESRTGYSVLYEPRKKIMVIRVKRLVQVLYGLQWFMKRV